MTMETGVMLKKKKNKNKRIAYILLDFRSETLLVNIL